MLSSSFGLQLLMLSLYVVSVRPFVISQQPQKRISTSLLEKQSIEEDDEVRGDFFLSQLADTLNEGETPDFMKPPSFPQDTKSKMKQWAGKYNREAMRARLQNRIDNFLVFFLWYETCPYCIDVLKILDSKDIPVAKLKMVELDALGQEKYAIRTEVIEMTNHMTIPALWIGGKFVGGLDEVQDLENSGELDSLLATLNALESR